MSSKITIDGENTTVIYEAARDVTEVYPNLKPFPVNTNQWVNEVRKAFRRIGDVLAKGIELDKAILDLKPSGIDTGGCINIELHLRKGDKVQIKPYVLSFDNNGKFTHPGGK